jgi:hypothetical protein
LEPGETTDLLGADRCYRFTLTAAGDLTDLIGLTTNNSLFLCVPRCVLTLAAVSVLRKSDQRPADVVKLTAQH